MRYEDFNMPTWMSMLIGTGVIEVTFLGISECYIFICLPKCYAIWQVASVTV